jgi:hypothetical protein
MSRISLTRAFTLENGFELFVQFLIPSEAILLEQERAASDLDSFMLDRTWQRFALLCNRSAYQSVLHTQGAAGLLPRSQVNNAAITMTHPL